MRKCLSVLLAVLLLAAAIPLGAVNVSAATYGDLTYTVFGGEVTITDCSSTAYGWVFIPDTIEGYPVTAIGDEAFYDCTSITAVTIPSSIKKIGEDAFESTTYAPNFTKVYIQDLAAWCAIDFDEYCHVLDGRALYVDYNATELVIPDTVTEIGDYAFSGCTSIETVVIGDSVTDIGEGAFEYCSNLQSVTMGSNVVLVQDYAFYTCESLIDVCLSPATRVIWDFAFAHCTALENVCVPLSLTTIDRCAFYDCPALTNVIYAGQLADRNAISINSQANDDIKNATWHYNNGLTYTISGQNLTITGVHAAFSGALEIPSTIEGYSVTAVGTKAFEKAAITSVSLPESITAIETNAFWFCDALTSITIPARVTSIGEDAFYGCSSLTDVYYGGTEEDRANMTIGTYNDPLLNATWHYAPSIPAGLLYEIADDEVTITGYTDELPADLTIPATIKGYPVTTIGDLAFLECPFSSVILPDSITTIESAAFSYSGIYSIVIPVGVTHIADDAFHALNCTFEVAADNPNYSALDGILFNKDQTTIVACGALSAYEYAIPDSVTTIGAFAFFSSYINSLVIPAGVTTIEGDAFATGRITDVYYGGTEADRANMTIDSGNDKLLNATWHCHEHTYDDNCDVDCNGCGDLRVAPHTYDNACDAACNGCGAGRTPADHVYDHEFDVDCNECGAVREMAETPVDFGGNSVSEDVSGLAFKFDVSVVGMKMNRTTAIYDGATIDDYKLIKMGAIATNGVDTIDIPCVYLCDLEPDSCGFAVRIINIPTDKYDVPITSTPYFVIEVDGVQCTVYGETRTASYNNFS